MKTHHLRFLPVFLEIKNKVRGTSVFPDGKLYRLNFSETESTELLVPVSLKDLL